MRYRNSLIATNVGCGDVLYQKTTHVQVLSNLCAQYFQAARAAVVTLIRQHFFRELVTKQTMKPVNSGCMQIFRSPWVESRFAPISTSPIIDLFARQMKQAVGQVSLSKPPDVTLRLPDAKHIVVYSKGIWYKVNIFHGRRILRAAELER